MILDYFYVNKDKTTQSEYFYIPKCLFKLSQFETLSNSAKLLYGLMLDCVNCSIQKEHFDEFNRIYIFFKMTNVMKQLHCKHDKAIKILSELDDVKGIGLIERIKQGQGKPDKIYVKKIIL